ncbi:MAG: hypothetical protein AB1938_08350 [Myxococcota bacterium]
MDSWVAGVIGTFTIELDVGGRLSGAFDGPFCDGFTPICAP